MQLTIPRQEFLGALAMANNVADRRNAFSPISSVFLVCQGERLTCHATNVVTSITAEVEAEVAREGQVLVNARTLFEVIKSLPPNVESVSLESSGPELLHVEAGRSHFKLKAYDPAGFPKLPVRPEGSARTMLAEAWSSLVRKIQFSILAEETRPHMNAALVESEGTLLRMVSTDGHRLTKAEIDLGGDEPLPFNKGILVPKRALTETKRLADSHEELSVSLAEPHLFLQAGEFSMAVRLLDEEFPPYQEVIPTDLEHKVVVDRGEFLDAIRRVALLATEDTKSVRFSLEVGKIRVSTSNPDLGEASEEIEADYEGGEFSVGFNARYFLELLGEMEGQEVVLQFGQDLDPCLAHPVDDPGYLGVIMPLRY